MYYVYFLHSEKNGDLYVGSTDNVERRISQHAQGRVKSTQAYRPWKLLGYEEYLTRGETMKRERFLKSHQQKDILKNKYGTVAKG